MASIIKLNWKLPLLRASIVLVPSYGAAWLTGKMVWVIPTLAAATFLAAAIGPSGDGDAAGGDENTTTRLDEEADDPPNGD